MTEALSLLRGLQPSAPGGGALSDRGGVFWIDIPEHQLESSLDLLPRLGYSTAVDLLELVAAGSRSGHERVRWRGRDYRLERIYEEDADAVREAAPDRRSFVLPTADGGTKQVRGYRGDGGDLTRRALPVCDARLLTNLVRPQTGGLFLDPFAGAGGIVVEAIASGYRALSLDIDPRLRHGLAATGAGHLVADARFLPCPAGSIDAVATELPFDPSTGDMLAAVLEQMVAVLRPGGRLAIMCADWQGPALQSTQAGLPLRTLLDSTIDRKGTPCVALAWEKEPVSK